VHNEVAGVDMATPVGQQQGVLKVHLPKEAEAKPKGRKVEIKTG
jgi:hypothetical protein